MEELLPDDAELIKRKDNWEDFFKKISATKDTEEVDLDNLSDILGQGVESTASDTEKENAPEAIETEEPQSQELVLQSPRTFKRELKLAVKEREKDWKKKGLSFTFDKVDEWLKTSDYQNRRELSDPRTGGHLVEQTHHKKMQMKRKYRKNNNRRERKESGSDIESDTDVSETDSNSSVDTAQYIRANQNHRTSKVTKTIIKKYIVKHINHHHRNERHAPITHRPRSMPLQAITNGRDEQSSKKKQRKTRHELNKRRRTRHEPSETESSESDSDTPLERSHLKRKTSSAKLLRVMSDSPLKSNNSEKTPKKVQSTWVSKDETRDVSILQPKVVLKKISSKKRSISPENHSKSKRLNVIQSSSSNNTTAQTENVLQETLDEIEEKSSQHSNTTRYSSIFNMSRKSWAHLPKKVVIYQPELNTTNDQHVRITNEHFEKAIGVENAKEFFQTCKYDKIIDANSQVILERPTTDEEEDVDLSDSDRDPLECFEIKLPRLSVVPMDES